jgi:hypothetical protein
MSAYDDSLSLLDFEFSDSEDIDKSLTNVESPNCSSSSTSEIPSVLGNQMNSASPNKLKRKLHSISSHDNLSEETKVLMEVPKLLASLFNMGDLNELTKVIETFFLPNCTLLTSAMRFEEVGRHKIIELWHSVSRSMPDMIFIINKVTFDKDMGMITANCHFTGTKRFSDPLEYLYNTSLFGPPGSIDPILRQKALNVQNSGGHYQVFAKAKWHVILNADLTKIQKLIVVQKMYDIREAPNCD